jgi:replicative DNA helicase
MSSPKEKIFGKTELDRKPPQAIEAESAVLGAVLMAGDAGIAIEILEPESFYKPGHRQIFRAMRRLFEKNEAIDIITVADELQRMGKLEVVGGTSYLSYLVDTIATSANLEYHARIVLEKYVLRRIIQIGESLAAMGHQANAEASALLERAEQEIFRLGESRVHTGFIKLRQILKSTFEDIQEMLDKKEHATGVASGFADLDSITAGLQRSDLIIVAGRPSMGKTSLALSMAHNIAVESKIPVGIFSLEMSKEQLVQRLLCAEARVDIQRLRKGYLKSSEWPKLTTAAGLLNEAPVFIDDTPALNVLEMRSKARRLKAEEDIGLLVVDYLQLVVAAERAENRQQEISSISRALKSLAKELDIPVLALSQLSRAVETRGGDKRPQLSDLRESGALEQDADVVLFVYRPELYFQEQEDQRGMAEIIVGKQRNGPLGTVKLAFIKDYARFESFAAVEGA